MDSVDPELPEPDARFQMANDRTALAWTRTALAFLAGGVALTSVRRSVGLPHSLDAAAAFVCLVGAGVALTGGVSWQRRDRAMRAGQPLPPGTPVLYVGGVVVLIGLVAAIWMLA